MNAQWIVFPTDFSKASDAALPYAASLAKQTGAVLQIVHVSERPLAYVAGDHNYGIVEPIEDVQRRMLLAVKPADAAVRCEHLLLRGEPAAAICDLAAETKADLIVMGTHGRSGLKRLVLGSVAESVVRHAMCPVLTMRESRATATAANNPANVAAPAQPEQSCNRCRLASLVT